MAMLHDLSKAQIAFQVSGGEPDELLVMRYRGTEGLSQLYRFEIELASKDISVAFDDVVGKPAVLTITMDAGDRWFHGVISRFEMTGEAGDQTYFKAELVPAVWLLTHRYGSRIFQAKTVPEIIEDILTKAGIVSDQFKTVFEGTYEPREYCVQYRETDFNFISRLMEEEGMFYYFEQTQEGHVMAMADSAAAYAPVEGEADVPYVPPSGMRAGVEHISRFRLGQEVRPGAVTLTDFNFLKPAVNLQAKSDIGRDAGLEFSDYPGEYVEQAAGANLAKRRVEEFETGRVFGVGQSNCVRLSPSKTFNLIEHPRETLNATYVITKITHQGKQTVMHNVRAANGVSSILDAGTRLTLNSASTHADQIIRDMAAALLQMASRFKPGDQTVTRALTRWLYHGGQVTGNPPLAAIAQGAGALESLAVSGGLSDGDLRSFVDIESPTYECRFECIPSTVTFRPPRVTPWPDMRGSQTARVVGPSGEEIHTDEYGRVKVQFNWDREGKFDDNSSCWIRVSQGSAGGQYGMMFLPRIGQEVVVDFLEGNPDLPLIVGRVYNADQMPPYTLPDEKTKSVIKTNSSKGGGGTNEICFEDLKDSEQILVYAQKDLHVRVNNDRVENIDNNRHLTVKKNKHELIKENKHVEVKLDCNNKVGGNLSLEVKGDVAEDIKGKHSEKVTGSYYLKATGSIVIESDADVTLKVGGNFIKISGSAIDIMGTKVNINSGGSAGTGSEATLAAPEAPIDARSASPGADVTYSGGEVLAAKEGLTDIGGLAFVKDEKEEKVSSWIEIEMVDEMGQPWAGEYYEIVAPDGKVIRKGSLDKNGRAHVNIPDPGTCQIRFPKLDAEAWERI